MNSEWEQYKATSTDDWKQYHHSNFENKISSLTPLQAEAQYLKGLGKGSLQKLGQFGASLLNSPTAAYEYFGGNPLYKHFQSPYQASVPQSAIEASGQRMGPGISDLLALIPPLKASQLVAKAPEGASLLAKFLQSGKKIGAVGTAGILEGLALGEPQRFQKAKEYGLESAGGEALGQLISKGLSFRPSSQYKKAQLQYQSALEKQKAEEQALKVAQGFAREKTGLSNLESFLPRIETKNAQISEAIDSLNELPFEEFPSAVTHQAYTQLPKIAEQNLNELNKNISKQMGAGANPDIPLSENVAVHFEGPRDPITNKREGGLKTEIGNEFNAVRDSLEHKNFILPTKISNDEIRKLAESSIKHNLGEAHLNEQTIKRFEESIRNDIKNNSTNGKAISAQVYFDRYRSLGHDINEEIYYLKRNKGKLSTDEIKAQKNKIVNMQQEYDDMEAIISNQSNPETIEKLNKAKERWANEYAPLRKDPIYRQMIDKGTIDTKDLMHAIRGNDESSLILKNYFQSDPNAAHLLANYQFANNPMALQALTPYQEQFINPQLTPHISRLMNEQEQAINNVSRATQQSEHFEKISKNIQEAQKQHNLELEERKKIETQIPKWKKEISDLTEHEKIIRHKLENKSLADEEVKKLKSDLKDLAIKKEKFNKRLSTIIKYGSIEQYIRHSLNANKK